MLLIESATGLELGIFSLKTFNFISWKLSPENRVPVQLRDCSSEGVNLGSEPANDLNPVVVVPDADAATAQKHLGVETNRRGNQRHPAEPLTSSCSRSSTNRGGRLCFLAVG